MICVEHSSIKKKSTRYLIIHMHDVSYIIQVNGVTCDVQLHITPTDLSPFSVVLPLAGEGGVLEPAEDLLRSLGGVGQHWLEGDARGEPTVGRELRDSAEEERRDESLVVWVLAGGRVEAEC